MDKIFKDTLKDHHILTSKQVKDSKVVKGSVFTAKTIDPKKKTDPSRPFGSEQFRMELAAAAAEMGTRKAFKDVIKRLKKEKLLLDKSPTMLTARIQNGSYTVHRSSK